MRICTSHLGVLGVLAVMIVVLSGCARVPSSPRPPVAPSPKVISSADGQCRLTVPPGWAEDPELNAGAELQVSNKKDELFAVVMTESKSDLDEMSKEKYSRITRRALAKSLKSSKTTGPKKLTISSVPALQYQVSGKMDGLDVVYLHTAIEGKKNFYQILAWTQKSKFDTIRPMLDQIISSFQEVEAAPPAKKP